LNSFTWNEGIDKEVRQFDQDELLSLMDYLAAEWPGVTVVQTLAKVFLWSRCRLEAVTSLRWDAQRTVGTERHFHVVEKRGVKWWFRLPEAVFEELMSLRIGGSPYVFAAYTEQLRQFHAASNRSERAQMVAEEFSPRCLGDWFYDRLAEWSAGSPKGHAHPHVFRKTSLQLSWDGDQKRQALADASVSEKVLRTSYLQMDDKERREASNRNFQRIAAALRTDVALRYGYAEPSLGSLEEKLEKALAAKNWAAVAQVSTEIANRGMKGAG
jgi:integrase